jgi:histidinol-phosphate aminotransferase
VPDWTTSLRPELAELSSYVPSDPAGVRIRLDANEAPPPGEAVRGAVARAIAATALERYPDARARELKARISARTGARPEEILIGTGSDDVIGVLLTALARPRERAPVATVLVPTPTFVMYRTTAKANGLKPVEVPLDDTWDLDVGQMKRAIEMTRPGVVFIASPNNPTGNCMSDDRIAAVIEAAAGYDTLVVVDEAYGDYAGKSLAGWRERYPNLGILRTLSKVGLAALRVGWLEADDSLIHEVDKTRQPYNVSATSQAAAAAVLGEAWAEVTAQVALVVRERDRVSSALRELPGVDVVPSDANFVWVGTQRPASEVYERLVQRGVLVRSFHASGGRLANRLRVTIGSPSDNDGFLEAFASAVRGS